jgi:Spy/CpxP family protein refolding chaperone
MKKVLWIPAIVVLLLFAFPLMAAAQETQGEAHEGPGDSVGILGPEGVFKLVDELKLSDDQANKLHAIKDSSKRDIFAAHNEMMTTVWDIQDEMKKESPDKAKLYAMADKIADTQKKIARLRIDQMLQVKAVLTAEQFTKLTSLIEARKDKMKKKLIDKVIGDK